MVSRRAYFRTYQRAWIAERRRAWIQERGPCALCGSSDRLEVDHIDRSAKLVHVSCLWSLSDNNPLKSSEFLKCQVLCYACHKAKTRSEFIKPLIHGTSNAYKKKHCRCAVCRAWNSRRTLRQNAANRLRQSVMQFRAVK